MGAAHAGEAGQRGADDRDPAQRRMGRFPPGKAGRGRMGIAGLTGGRLATGTVQLAVVGRAAARGRTRRSSWRAGADLGRTSAVAAHDRRPDLGLACARGTARRGSSALVGRVGGAARALPVRGDWRTIVGRATSAGSVLGCTACGWGRCPGRSLGALVEPAGRARLGCASRRAACSGAPGRGRTGTGHRRLGRACGRRLVGRTPRGCARSTSDCRPGVGRRGRAARLRAPGAVVG